MRYHLIAIGGSVMHNVAIDLKDLGHIVTGSDDEIYEPSLSKLKAHQLLPDKMGWDVSNISSSIDTIILGKHARKDNPELLRALELNIPVVSFPEFIAASSNATYKVCIAGSHGKTTTTSMIMHVLKYHGVEFDYLVGANLSGFEKMVKMSNADVLVVEGDEYPSSCLDNRAKMLHYQPNISVITGLAWDHVNIYTRYEDYKEVFHQFLLQMKIGDHVFFDQNDEALLAMMINNDYECTRQSYLPFEINKKGNIIRSGKEYPIKIFGTHNLSNLKSAFFVCQKLGINEAIFFEAISSFTGAAKRLELIIEDDNLVVYKDFAHAPSKCKATSDAIREKYPNRKIKGILELHTFSSLSQNFIEHYRDSMNSLDEAVVFYDPEALKMKKMPNLDPRLIKMAFNHPKLRVLNDKNALSQSLTESMGNIDVLLLMSSGNLGGIDVKTLLS